MRMKYRGDRSSGYLHAAGTGLVGKVMGPNVQGDYFVVTEARYDAAQDITFATVERLRRPEALLDEAVS